MTNATLKRFITEEELKAEGLSTSVLFNFYDFFQNSFTLTDVDVDGTLERPDEPMVWFEGYRFPIDWFTLEE